MPTDIKTEIDPSLCSQVFLVHPSSAPFNNFSVYLPCRQSELEKQLSQQFELRSQANVVRIGDERSPLWQIGYQRVLDATPGGVNFDQVNLLAASLVLSTDEQLATLKDYIRAQYATDIDTLSLVAAATNMLSRSETNLKQDSLDYKSEDVLKAQISAELGMVSYFDTPSFAVPAEFLRGQGNVYVDRASCHPYQDTHGRQFYKLYAPGWLMATDEIGEVSLYGGYVSWVDVNNVDLSYLIEGLDAVISPFGSMRWEPDEATAEDPHFTTSIETVAERFKFVTNNFPPRIATLTDVREQLEKNISKIIVQQYDWQSLQENSSTIFNKFYANDRQSWEEDVLDTPLSDLPAAKDMFGSVVDQLEVHHDLFQGVIFYNIATQNTFQINANLGGADMSVCWGELNQADAITSIAEQDSNSLVDEILYETDVLPLYIKSTCEIEGFDSSSIDLGRAQDDPRVQLYINQVIDIADDPNWGNLAITRIQQSAQQQFSELQIGERAFELSERNRNSIALPPEINSLLDDIDYQKTIGTPDIKLYISDSQTLEKLSNALLATNTEFAVIGNQLIIDRGSLCDTKKLMVELKSTNPIYCTQTDAGRHMPAHLDETKLKTSARATDFEHDIARAQTSAHEQTKSQQQELSQSTER